jgi:hypothetical protein
MSKRDKNEHRLRVYEQWQGNEVFFCEGRIIAGPNWKAPFYTSFLMIAPTAVFLAFPATYLMQNLNPVFMVIRFGGTLGSSSCIEAQPHDAPLSKQLPIANDQPFLSLHDCFPRSWDHPAPRTRQRFPCRQKAQVGMCDGI